MLFKVVLFAYSQGIVGSRALERACPEHVTFIALSGNTRPHFTTITHFLSTLGEDIAHVFAAVLAICDREGLLGRGMFAIDGVKLPSNASKHRVGRGRTAHGRPRRWKPRRRRCSPAIVKRSVGQASVRSFSALEGKSEGIFNHAFYPTRAVCEAVGGALRAGDSLSVSFVADAAPGFGDAHLSGVAAGPIWPGEQLFENEPAMRVVDSLVDDLTGWAAVPSAAPLQALSNVATATQALGALHAALASACAAGTLISRNAICGSLDAKLNSATDALAHRDDRVASTRVAAFRAELGAQRGKTVSELAYTVLHALAGLVTVRIG